MRALLFTLIAGCYTPDVADCTITCTGAAACAAGQVCGSDGYCATPSVAGHCGRDGGVVEHLVTLHVMISGPGSVRVDNAQTCMEDCSYQVAPGSTHLLEAIETHEDRPFSEWTEACAGQDATCTVTPQFFWVSTPI